MDELAKQGNKASHNEDYNQDLLVELVELKLEANSLFSEIRDFLVI
jgi:hypothetical protein